MKNKHEKKPNASGKPDLSKVDIGDANPKVVAAFLAFAEKLGRTANAATTGKNRGDLRAAMKDLKGDAKALRRQSKKDR